MAPLEEVLKKIEAARHRCGSGAPVKLIAVTKKRSTAEIKALYDIGQRDFAESRIHEFLEKYPELPSDIKWHFIGNLQKNKVAKADRHFTLLHSVDSFELADKISKTLYGQSILLQVNTSGEESKHGLSINEWQSIFPSLLALPSIKIEGFMTMAPLTEDTKRIRATFSKLREFRDHLSSDYGISFPILSMGMSQDYEIAIEEGSTHVRIGTALFAS